MISEEIPDDGDHSQIRNSETKGIATMILLHSYRNFIDSHTDTYTEHKIRNSNS